VAICRVPTRALLAAAAEAEGGEDEVADVQIWTRAGDAGAEVTNIAAAFVAEDGWKLEGRDCTGAAEDVLAVVLAC